MVPIERNVNKVVLRQFQVEVFNKNCCRICRSSYCLIEVWKIRTLGTEQHVILVLVHRIGWLNATIVIGLVSCSGTLVIIASY